MNATQLEALVLQAVDALRNGSLPEDDRIEFKRDWPSPDKARQLAAAANQARGEPLIYVIGIDETDGTVRLPDAVDPAAWWAQFETRFDEVSPDLEMHINVAISGSDRVVALLFRTDRVPYVVKVVNRGAVEREIPIRSGTRTRSAKRHELLRLLLPSMKVPQLTAVAGAMTLYSSSVTNLPGNSQGDDDELRLHLATDVYFEPTGTAPSFLPIHAAVVEVSGGGISATGRVIPGNVKSNPDSALHVRQDGIRVSEAGTIPLLAVWDIPRSNRSAAAAVPEWNVRMSFAVSGTDKAAIFTMTLGNRVRIGTTGGNVRFVWNAVDGE